MGKYSHYAKGRDGWIFCGGSDSLGVAILEAVIQEKRGYPVKIIGPSRDVEYHTPGSIAIQIFSVDGITRVREVMPAQADELADLEQQWSMPACDERGRGKD